MRIPARINGLISRSPIAGWIGSLHSFYIQSVRSNISRRHLHGNGIEIGALHMPMRVPGSVTVKYVDKLSHEELIRIHPELETSRIIKPDIVDDGFSLLSIAENSQDFAIANHVLEHSPNPLGVVSNWTRVLRLNGVLFISVPIHSNWIDCGREVTSVAHMIEDYSCFETGGIARLQERNRMHYIEWYKVGMPNYCRSIGQPFPSSSMEEYVEKNASLDGYGDIHFHTFSKQSFSGLLQYFCANIDASIKLIELHESRGEIIAVLNKL